MDADQPLVLWVALGIALVVYADLLVVEVRRVRRELRRIHERVAAYRELPIASLIASSPGEVERLAGALDQISALAARAERALAGLGLR